MPRTRRPLGWIEPEPPVVRTPVRVRRRPEERGWAAEPVRLEWRQTPPGRVPDMELAWSPWFTAETPLARWTVQVTRFEAIAVCEPREAGGRRRHMLGSFGTVEAAQAACQRDHDRRLQLRQELEPKPERKRWRRPVPSLAKSAAG